MQYKLDLWSKYGFSIKRLLLPQLPLDRLNRKGWMYKETLLCCTLINYISLNHMWLVIISLHCIIMIIVTFLIALTHSKCGKLVD